MHKIIKNMNLALIAILGFISLFYLITEKYVNHFIYLADNNWSVIVGSIIIILFLLLKTYGVISNLEGSFLASFRLGLLITLALLLVINVIFGFNSEHDWLIKMSGVFRILSLLGLVFTVESFLIRKLDVRKIIVWSVFTGITVLVLLLLSENILAHIVGFYYYMTILYMVFLLFQWHITSENKVRQIGLNIIILALLNDLFVISFKWSKFELSFIAIALSLSMIYGYKFYRRFIELKKIEVQNETLLNENKRLLVEKEKTLKSVEVLKSDLSYKFMKKQNYFENLELAFEVLEGSIIVINDQFKIDLAYGDIIETNGLGDLTGVDIGRALFDVSSDEGQYFKSVVSKIFNADDEVRENLFLSLLDKTLRIGNVMYEMKYYVMQKKDHSKVFIIHADIVSTQTKQGAMLEREKEISDMLITITKNSEIFFSDLSSYVSFCQNIHACIDKEKTVDENVFKVLRRVHTYKGVFDQYHMHNTVKGLNNVENELFNILHNQSDISIDAFSKMILAYEMESLMKTDLGIVTARLGNQFLENKKRILVDMTAFDRMMIKMSQLLGNEHPLIRDMAELKAIDVKEMIASYQPYVERIAKEQSKEVIYDVSGDSVKVSRAKYIDFFESLIHILKNSVAHGIEYPDERREKGKAPCAKIHCHVKSYDDQMVISISDDGRGIDVKEIKNRLFILGKYSIDELDELDDDVVTNMIVEDGITSAIMPNSLSGRGVGMGSIREIVKQLKGSISVKSKNGRGVTYDITLPYEQTSDVHIINYDHVRSNLSLQIERILTKSNRKTEISSNWQLDKQWMKDIHLYEATCTLKIQGIRETRICVTLDEKLILHLINAYGLQLKYKGSNLKVMNEAVIMFVEDISKRMSEALKGPRQNLIISSGKIISTNTFRQLFDSKKALCSSIDINEGKLTAMVLENSKGVDGV